MTSRSVLSLLLLPLLLLAGCAAAADPSGGGEEDALLAWLRGAGGSVDGVRLGEEAPLPRPPSRIAERPHQSHHRRGVVASRAFAKGEVVAEVPLDAALSIESALSGGEGLVRLVTRLVEGEVTQDTRAFLALHLLNEAFDHTGATRTRAEFVRRLPAQPASVCFFSREEAAQLQVPDGSPVVRARDEALRLFHDAYHAIRRAMDGSDELRDTFPAGAFTEAWWNWAYATVMNSAFRLAAAVPAERCDASGSCEVVEQAVGTLALLPLASDMNYANPRHATAELVVVPGAAAASAGEGGAAPPSLGPGTVVRVVAARELAEGDELLLAYGGEPMTNTELLVQFGFALPVNEAEGVRLDLGLDDPSLEREDPLLRHRQHIISANGLATSTVVRLDAAVDPLFMHALRAKELFDADIRGLARLDYAFSPEVGYFSLQNELRVHVQLLGSVEGILSGYPTTLREDMALLAAGGAGLSPAAAQAVAFRVAVKRVLHATMLSSFDRLRAVFDGLVGRWGEDVGRFERGERRPAAAAAAASPATPEDEAREIAEWRAGMDEWRKECGKWSGQWREWVAEAVEPDWLAPSEAL